MAALGAFLGKVGHLLLDPAGVDAVATQGLDSTGDHSGVEGWQACGGRGAKKRSGSLPRRHEATKGRGDTGTEGRGDGRTKGGRDEGCGKGFESGLF